MDGAMEGRLVLFSQLGVITSGSWSHFNERSKMRRAAVVVWQVHR
jgi:hypothetical protein